MKLHREPVFFAGIFFVLGIVLRHADSFIITLILVILTIFIFLSRKQEFLILLGFTAAGYLRGEKNLEIKRIKQKLDGRLIEYTLKVYNDNKFYIPGTSIFFFISGARGLEHGSLLRVRGKVKLKGNNLFLHPEKFEFVRGPGNIAEKIHNKINQKLFESLGESESYYLTRSLLTGDRGYLREDIKDAFRKSGISHLLAISGLHAGLIFIILNIILSFFPLPSFLRYSITMLLLFVYSFIVGSQAPITRAFIFILFLTLPFYTGRRISSLNSLGIALLVSSFLNPTWVTSPGFILSYLATFGIIYTLPFIHLRPNIFTKYIFYPLYISVSAQLFTLPAVALFFGNISLLSPVSNLIFIPLIFLLISETFLVLISSFLGIHFFVTGFSNCVHFLTDIIISLSQKISTLPLSSIDFKLPAFILLPYYLIIVLVPIFMRGRKKHDSDGNDVRNISGRM